MKKWDCEIVSPLLLPSDIMEFCQRIGVQVLRVPIRERGLTSSGNNGKCYLNVNILTKLFGGSAVLGWMLVRNPRQELGTKTIFSSALLGHAIWLNPQNRASCVTGKAWGRTLSIYQKNGKSYIDYAVWGVAQNSPLRFARDLYFRQHPEGNGYKLEWTAEKTTQSVLVSHLNREMATRELIDRKLNMQWESVERRIFRTKGVARGTRELLDDSESGGGGFTEKSVATGKTYEEIREERLNRLASSAIGRP